MKPRGASILTLCPSQVDGGVYDVTKFLDSHPGGKKILLRNCTSRLTLRSSWRSTRQLADTETTGGKDASKSFAKFHNDRILKKYEKLKIGEVQDGAKL